MRSLLDLPSTSESNLTSISYPSLQCQRIKTPHPAVSAPNCPDTGPHHSPEVASHLSSSIAACGCLTCLTPSFVSLNIIIWTSNLEERSSSTSQMYLALLLIHVAILRLSILLSLVFANRLLFLFVSYANMCIDVFNHKHTSHTQAHKLIQTDTQIPRVPTVIFALSSFPPTPSILCLAGCCCSWYHLMFPLLPHSPST